MIDQLIVCSEQQPRAIPLTGPKRGRVVYGCREGLYGRFIKGDSLAGSINEEIKENITVDGVSASVTTVVSTARVVEVSSTSNIIGTVAPVADVNLSRSSSSPSSSSSSSSSASSTSVSPEPASTLPTSNQESNGLTYSLKRKRKQDEDSTVDDPHNQKRPKLKGHKGRFDQEAMSRVNGNGVERVKESKKKKKTKIGSKNARLETGKTKAGKDKKPVSKSEPVINDVVEIKPAIIIASEEGSQDGPQSNHVHADRLALINGTKRNEVCYYFPSVFSD